jgi:hypothetical protein
MVSPLLGRELRAWFSRDEVTELRGAALEFAGLVCGIDPIEDLGFGVAGLSNWLVCDFSSRIKNEGKTYHLHKCRDTEWSCLRYT